MRGLHVDSVLKSFGGRQLLTDIFLSCEPGEIVGLLGRNGSGKSTLMKVIFGAMGADSKFVRLNGKANKSLFSNRNLISYIPQDNCLPAHVKIQRLIPLMCAKRFVQKVRSHNLVKPFLEKKANELSGGEKRIIEILLIMHSEAHIILIDEPFNGVAPIHRDEIKIIIRELSEEKGFIITDHDYADVWDIATRMVILHNGGLRDIKIKEDLAFYGYVSGL